MASGTTVQDHATTGRKTKALVMFAWFNSVSMRVCDEEIIRKYFRHERDCHDVKTETILEVEPGGQWDYVEERSGLPDWMHEVAGWTAEELSREMDICATLEI